MAGQKYSTLNEFENHYYPEMSAPNYAWFQFRFHDIARKVYDRIGAEGLKAICKSFSNGKQF
ncbi:MAG: hypothetical protein MI784_16105 [Cytophagales bacterium]|nr:hypothetical protein [Cytophagales bacterium]